MTKNQQMMTMIADEMPQIMQGIDEQMAVAKATGDLAEVRQLEALRADLAQVHTNGFLDRLVFDLATFTLPEASIKGGIGNRPPFIIWPKTDAHLECCLAEPESNGADYGGGTAHDSCGCGPVYPTPVESYDLKACGFINWYLKFFLDTKLTGKYDAVPNSLPFTATGTTCIDHVLCEDQRNLDACPDFDSIKAVAIRCKTCPLAQLLVDNKRIVTYLIIFLLPECDTPYGPK